MKIYNQVIVEDKGVIIPINVGDELLILTDGSCNEKKIIGKLENIKINDYLIVNSKKISINHIDSIAKF